MRWSIAENCQGIFRIDGSWMIVAVHLDIIGFEYKKNRPVCCLAGFFIDSIYRKKQSSLIGRMRIYRVFAQNRFLRSNTSAFFCDGCIMLACCVDIGMTKDVSNQVDIAGFPI